MAREDQAVETRTGLGPAWTRFETLADETVVARVLAGEVALYELLMRRHNRRLFRVARAIVKDSDEAEDVMQEAYVRAFEHLRDFEGRAKFATWLTTITVHEASARRRRRARVTSLETIGQDEPMGRARDDDPRQVAENRELASVLERAVDGLPPRYRTVFVLREVEGLTTTETAACLGISEATAKVRLHRARAVLRTSLERRVEGAGRETSAKPEQATAASRGEIYEFHLSRCDRVVARVFERIQGASPDGPRTG